jgi:hypothetical protein
MKVTPTSSADMIAVESSLIRLPYARRRPEVSDPVNNPIPSDEPAGRPQSAEPVRTSIGQGDGATLDPADERTIWVGRTDWKYFFGTVFLGFIVVAGIWGLILGLWRGTASYETAKWVGVVITGLAILLTGQRIFVERGVLSRTTDQTELIRVDDVRVKQSLWDRIFGLGSIEILSTDTTHGSLIIQGVEKPHEIAEHIRGNMRKLRSKSLFVEHL